MSIIKDLDSKISIFVKSQIEEGSAVPLGLRIRNLGCIRYNKKNKWIGQTGNINGFCSFSYFNFGLRALTIILCRYILSDKLTDVWSVVYKYAPPAENDTKAYYKRVVSICGFDGFSTNIDVLKEQIAMLAFAIVSIEIGNFFGVFIKGSCLKLFCDVIRFYVDSYLNGVIYPVYGKVSEI